MTTIHSASRLIIYPMVAVPGLYARSVSADISSAGDSLIDIPNQLPGLPSAVLVMSGHWEAADFTVSTAEMPSMIYDYDGFPEAMYRITYPAPDSLISLKQSPPC
ncbi:hypothetical protein P4S72_16435 [Vibrio sp. PP-XX7]